jgi:hypothetical protein
LHPAAFGHHILDNQHFFARFQDKTTAQNETAFLFFSKNKPGAQPTGHFLPDNEASHGWRDYRGGAPSGCLQGKSVSQFLHNWHLLKRQGALEVFAAVEAASENEMPLQQGAGLTKDLECFFFCHR